MKAQENWRIDRALEQNPVLKGAANSPRVDGMDDVIREFIGESYEGLDRLDQDLLALEKTPDDRVRLAEVFRAVHTIKGTCGFFGFSKLEELTHAGEYLLSELRDGHRRFDSEVASGLFVMADGVRQILGSIEEAGDEGAADYQDTVAMLKRLHAGANGGASGPPGGVNPAGMDVSPASGNGRLGMTIPNNGNGRDGDASTPSEPNAVPAKVEGSVRVAVEHLDKLMNLVGELVLARNQILRHTDAKETNYAATTQRLSHITSELQEGVMKARMQPISNVLNKFPRLVRDLAAQLGKRVSIEIEGEDTELDRTILEAIKDPLTHMLRNSVDHGIESPEARVAVGKDEEGKLSLRAHHEGGLVNIEISDDGGGIDPDRVRAKAVDNGVLSSREAKLLSDREAVNLIFRPGFSTASAVTHVSGRGVGMDVVRANVERIGGTVEVQGAPGVGTTLRMKIPLTLAIIPALVVSQNGERYAIPQVSLLELVSLDTHPGRVGIEYVQGAPVYRLRGRLLPLVYLGAELQSSGHQPVDRNIVVVRADSLTFGLVVEEILDTEEIVVKPLGKQLKGLKIFTGATVMGDGAVALILDVLGIAQQSGVLAEGSRNRAGVERSTSENVNHSPPLVVVSLGQERRLAVNMTDVVRLEALSAGRIEFSGQQRVLQYRGEVMPVHSLNGLLNFEEADEDWNAPILPMVVCDTGDQTFGLVVREILDIVENAASATSQDNGSERGVTRPIVVQGRVTDLLDIGALASTFDNRSMRSRRADARTDVACG